MHRMNRIFLALAALVIFGFAAPSTKADVCGVVAGNLVSNCGFETGTFSSWTQSGNLGFTAVDNGTFLSGRLPNSGMFQAHFGPVTTLGFLSQTLVTTPGTYTLSFWLGNTGGTPNSFSASFGGVPIPGSSLTNAPASSYTFFTFSVVATGSSSLLEFAFRQDPGYWFLDDVVVVREGAAPVPEPVTMLLLGSGLAGMGLKLRRRRKQQLAGE